MSASISPGSTRCSTSAMVTRPHIAASGLKLRADWRNTRLPCRSPFQARTSPKSATTASSITNSLSPSGVENVRTSFAGEDTVTLPSESYLHGSPPSATWVPTPVAVKNAGIPDPPARIRSASVPCGVSSTSSSPERYCRANSLFSPTYDATIRRSRPFSSSSPSPQPSTPALFETASSSRVPASSTAWISTVGIPHSPNPPTAIVAPSATSATASSAEPTTLSISASHSSESDPSAFSPSRLPRVSRTRSLLTVRTDLLRQVGGRNDPLSRVSRVSDWPRVRLHVVTGKGGTGKSTVAAGLALGLASRGKDVLLCEVEGRQGIARMFDVDPLPYAERRIATGLRSDGPADDAAGVVHALHIDAEAALMEYLAMYYRLGRAVRALDRFGVIEFATTIAPGVRDVLLTGKVYEAVQRNSRNKGAIEYEAVVLDAPPTGRITQFLNVSDELAGLAKVGPIKHQADTMMTLFRSPRTAVHFVTVLEEMPVQETADGIAHLREVGLPVGGVVVNLVRPRDLRVKDLATARKGELDRAAISSDLTAARVDVSTGLVAGCLGEARDHAVRRALEDAQRKLVKRL